MLSIWISQLVSNSMAQTFFLFSALCWHLCSWVNPMNYFRGLFTLNNWKIYVLKLSLWNTISASDWVCFDKYKNLYCQNSSTKDSLGESNHLKLFYSLSTSNSFVLAAR